MSKKRFSTGLDDLFREETSHKPTPTATSTAADRERRAAHKNFASELDALLQEVLEESLEKYASNPAEKAAPADKTRRSKAAMPLGGGLDALIRQTIDVQELNLDEATGKRRLTVAVDRHKLEQLKLIARLENAYLKDLLTVLIDEYIRGYSQQKGLPM